MNIQTIYLLIQVNTYKYSMLFECVFEEFGVRIIEGAD